MLSKKLITNLNLIIIQVAAQGSGLLNRIFMLINTMDLLFVEFRIRIILIHVEQWNDPNQVTSSTVPETVRI